MSVATETMFVAQDARNGELPRSLPESEARALVAQNRARLLAVLRSLPEERHSHEYYFESSDGYAQSKMKPDSNVCVNGAALLLAGFRNFDTIYDEAGSNVELVVGGSLGITSRDVVDIDSANMFFTFAEMADWFESRDQPIILDPSETIYEFAETLSLA